MVPFLGHPVETPLLNYCLARSAYEDAAVLNATRKLSHRKADRAMRPDNGTTPTATFPEILNGLLFD